jgi:hypothetical protein
MPRYVFAVYSNPVEGREQEYLDWYADRHLDDLRACVGVISAKHLKLADEQFTDVPPQPFKYFALYEIETDDVRTFMNDVLSRVDTARMPRSPALGTVSAILWKVLKENE